MQDAVEIRGVTKTFGPKTAVADLDLSVPAGCLCGFIGPNGAGKTTTIRMIMSILFPDRGEIRVLGRASAIESKDRIGYLPEERGVYRKMKVLPFLVYIARLKGLDGGAAMTRARDWLGRMALADVGRKKCEELSKGMQQKVQFIAAVIHEPDLLILDEPFSGLDPVNSRLLRDLIDEQHRAGRTIIFSTHQMSQAEALCDRIVMIHEGRKVLDDTPGDIAARFDHRSVIAEPADENGAGSVLAGLPMISAVERVGRAYELALRDGVVVSDAIATIAAAAPMRRIELRRTTLEDVFIEIVQGSGSAVSEREALRQQLRNTVGAIGDTAGD